MARRSLARSDSLSIRDRETKVEAPNVGVWVDDARAWPWLRQTMTIERFAELLPETARLQVDRFEIPRVPTLNFIIHGLLDGGATSARRFDKQAKALGEWLRPRHVPLPKELLPDGH